VDRYADLRDCDVTHCSVALCEVLTSTFNPKVPGSSPGRPTKGAGQTVSLTCGERLVERATQHSPNIRFVPRWRSRPRVESGTSIPIGRRRQGPGFFEALSSAGASCQMGLCCYTLGAPASALPSCAMKEVQMTSTVFGSIAIVSAFIAMVTPGRPRRPKS
jgi:hypothetical protein